MSKRQWQIVTLIIMSMVGIGLGIWLFRAGFTALGCLFIVLFVWRGQQFAFWLIIPKAAPAEAAPSVTSRWERLLLSILSLPAAGLCGFGIYWCWKFPEDWQTGLVFILFGMIPLILMTARGIQSRKKQVRD